MWNYMMDTYNLWDQIIWQAQLLNGLWFFFRHKTKSLIVFWLIGLWIWFYNSALYPNTIWIEFGLHSTLQNPAVAFIFPDLQCVPVSQLDTSEYVRTSWDNYCLCGFVINAVCAIMSYMLHPSLYSFLAHIFY